MRVGDWTLLQLLRDVRSRKKWRCRCICGTERVLPAQRLDSGGTRSCGCTKGGRITAAKTRHGEAKQAVRTREYRIWANMLTRCTNTTGAAYKDYGGRGIRVCTRWKKFENFLEDMGRCLPSHTLERRNNNESYRPSNCRWATRAEQAANTRRNRRLTCFGRTQHLAAWARELAVPRTRIEARLRLGWTLERALMEPCR
jgi:hypothetical protein